MSDALRARILGELERSIAERGGTGRRPHRILWALDPEPTEEAFAAAVDELVESGELVLDRQTFPPFVYLVPARFAAPAEPAPLIGPERSEGPSFAHARHSAIVTEREGGCGHAEDTPCKSPLLPGSAALEDPLRCRIDGEEGR